MHNLCWSVISEWLMYQLQSSTLCKWAACWPQWADGPGGFCLRLPAYHASSMPLSNPDEYMQIINRARFNLIISHHHWRGTASHRNSLWCYCSVTDVQSVTILKCFSATSNDQSVVVCLLNSSKKHLALQSMLMSTLISLSHPSLSLPD